MRKFLLILLLSMWIIPANAFENERTVQNAITHDTLTTYSTIGVPTTTTAITDSQSLVNTTVAGNVGVMYKATSSGTITLSLQALRSFQRPTTEGSADASYIVWNSSQSISDSAWHMVTLDTIVEPYLTFKVTGSGSNDASTTIQIKVAKQ